MAKKMKSDFVPEAEQPYKIPDNWRWVRLGLPATIIMGQSPDGDSTTDDKAFLPLIGGAADMGELYPNATRYTKKPTKISAKGDVILCVRATLGRPIYSDGSYCLGRGVAAIRPNIGGEKFYRYALICFEQYLLDHATGSTFAQISSSVLKNMPIPLPPLAEQQRIVDRIESLFTKLDAARDNAQAVVDGFETRKAAILYRAFNGELMGTHSYATVSLSMIAKEIRIGPFGSALHKDDYVSDKIPVINPKHIVNQNIIPDLKTSISEEKARELSAYRLRENDIILARRGVMGRSAPVTAKEDGWLCGTGSMIIRLKEGYDATLYSQILSSGTSLRYLEENAVGSTMSNLNEKIIRDLPVPNFSLYEQKKILAVISDLLNGEYRVMEFAQQVIDNIDAMKKAILGRAFRGELGTNDPSEASPEHTIIGG